MKTRSFSALSALAAALAVGLASVPAHAGIITTFTAPTQTTIQGGFLVYTATVQNTSATDTIYFLGDNADFLTAPGPTDFGSLPIDQTTVTLDDTPFTAFYGTSLAPGATQTYTLFNLYAGVTSTPGSYLGDFTIQGNTDPNGPANDLSSTNFEADITPGASPAPEPSQIAVLGLFGLMLGGGAVLARRRAVARAA